MPVNRMSAERELEMMQTLINDTVRKFEWWRQQWLQMANYVHNTHCGNSVTHLWRQCKSPLCRRFKEIVNEKNFELKDSRARLGGGVKVRAAAWKDTLESAT